MSDSDQKLGMAGHDTLKLAVSQERIGGINWFYARCYKFW